MPDSETPARSKTAIDRLVARREVHLRERTLWRMLYGTAGRAEEVLGVNIEDLDFAGRRALVKAKGARSRARHRGQTRENCGTCAHLHAYRHSGLTLLGEAGAGLLMSMAKSSDACYEVVSAHRSVLWASMRALMRVSASLTGCGSSRRPSRRRSAT